MAEAERRMLKTPLLKQPEIEMEEHDVTLGEEETSSGVDTTGSSSFMDRSDSMATASEQESPSKRSANGSADNLADDLDLASPSPPQPIQVSTQDSPPFQAASRPPTITTGVSLSKQKPLLRGTAICEGASPPPQPVPEVKVITTPAPDTDDVPCMCTTPILGQPRDISLVRSQLQKNGSQSSDAGTTSSLSRESSIEKGLYKDSTGVDLEEFIKKTLYKSPKDRKMLLQIEKDFRQFVEHDGDQYLQLAEMSSYDRMLVHRVAAYYGMDHNINQTGKCVIVSKTKYTRVPEFSFEEHLKSNPDSEPKRPKIILKSKPHSFEERSRVGDKNQFAGHRTKSLEERQKSYDEKRKQIFGASSQDENGTNTTSLELMKPSLSNQWSSTDSSGYGTEDSARRGGRGIITKSNSYGGKPTIHLTPANPRTCSLSKADSIQSGSYESPPVARPNKLPTQSPENSQSPLSRSSSADAPSQVQPHINPDGSLYRYDPNGPPPSFLAATPTTPSTPAQPAASGTLTFGTSVQYQDPSDVCNVFSRLTMEGGMEGSTQVLTLPHPQLQPPQPTHQQHHPHGQHQLVVSTSLPQHMAQAPQQYPNSYTTYTGIPAPYYSNPQVVQGAPVRYVITTGPPAPSTPIDSQGPPMVYGGTGASSVPSGVYSAHPQHQTFSLLPAPNAMQPGLNEPVGMAPGAMYSQTVFAGPVGDGSGNGNPYMPYGASSGVYTYTTYTPPGSSMNGAQVGPSGTFYGPPQSTSPQLSFTGFSPGPTGQPSIRPTTPPSQIHPAHGIAMNIAQPVGTYPGQQATGHPSHHRVNSPPQFSPYPGTVYTPTAHFPAQVRPVGQMVQVPVGPPTSAATVSVPSHSHQQSHHHHHHQPHQSQHSVPPLQHSQSFSMMRANPGGGASQATNHIGLTPTANGNPTPPQPVCPNQPHPVMMKSMSMGCIRPFGGAATTDKESAGMVGGTTFMAGVNQAAVQIPAQFITSSLRPAQQGELRMMGATGIRPPIQALPLTFTHQPGQPVKNRVTGPRHPRGSKRSNIRSGSTAGDGQMTVTTASASVARAISADPGVAQPVFNRQ